jgi:CheY-like chemotaxis protein
MPMSHLPSSTSDRALRRAHVFAPELLLPSPDGMRLGAAHAPTSKTASMHAQAVATRRTVLIVEDDPMLQVAMRKHFARIDVYVRTASHYAAALAHLALGTPDLAWVDIGLPNESGYELCEYIRGPLGLKALPIVVTSELGSPEERAYAEEAGANAFLVKPFSIPNFGANVNALLDGVWPRPVGVSQAAAKRRNDDAVPYRPGQTATADTAPWRARGARIVGSSRKSCSALANADGRW